MAATTTTTNGGNTSHLRKFPEIFLDTTLAELLAEEPNSVAKEAICNLKPCADPQHTTLPLNRKYLITSSAAGDGNVLAHLQLENVSYLLSFWAGNMDVALVACQGLTDDSTLTKEVIQQNAESGFSVINEKQRPRPRTFAHKDDFTKHYANSGDKVRWSFAVDFAEKISSFIHPELQYKLNSKRWLAECPLESARDRIIDPQCSCTKHTAENGLWYYGINCSDCQNAIKTEVARLQEMLKNTEPPFVLKLAQSLGSVGTMLVKNKETKDQTIEQISKVQEEQLRFVTAENAHIHPASLVLSDMLPGDTNALNFYVRSDGSIKFLGACQQLSTRTSEGGRQHTCLTWDQQDKLEKKFRDKLAEIGKVLNGQGYFGPCGADIMETEDGSQYVIDLNVRTATSTVLGCLKGHCEKRGFNACGVYECILLRLPREELEKEFEKELEEGRFILLGNTRLGPSKRWAYPVVLAGEDQEYIKDLGARILKFEASGSDDAEDAGGA